MTGRGPPDQRRPESPPGPARPLEKPHGKAAAENRPYPHLWATHGKEELQKQLEEQTLPLPPGRRNAGRRPSQPKPRSRQRKPGGAVEKRMPWMNAHEGDSEIEW